jgi:hypothetical protein
MSAIGAPGVLPPTLSLVRTDGTGPVLPGEIVVVELRMSHLNQPAVGYQAFLEFDTAKLEFMSGSYTASPFGLTILSPIGAFGGRIDLAAGINQGIGQPPSAADAALAQLTFLSLDLSCKPRIEFRSASPPTRLAAAGGGEIAPLALAGPVSACPCDWNCNGIVNSQDFFDFLGEFFTGGGDFNNNGVVNSQDFFDFLACFFGEPPGCVI